MTQPVSDFRQTRINELAALLDGCAEERLDIATEVSNMIARMRELHFFAPDLVTMTEQLKDLALRNNLVDWAQNGNGRALDQLPWGRMREAAEQLMSEPRLHERDWARGPIQPQFAEAVNGWIDLRDCARRARMDSARSECIADVKLFLGAVNVLKYGAIETFKSLDSPVAGLMDDVFQSILERDDLDLDMFPAALTYFGDVGIVVLNQLNTESDDLYGALLRFADDGMFDDQDAGQAAEAPVTVADTRAEPAAVRPSVAATGIRLAKGGNVSLTDQVPDLSRVLVVLGWQASTAVGASFDVDASAIACGDDQRVFSDGYFVFRDNPASPERAIVQNGRGITGDIGGVSISVDLAAVPASVVHIYFPVSIHDEHAQGLTFGQVHNAFIQVVDADAEVELARFDLLENASTETAMVFGELYRRAGKWKFRAVGQGYASGLSGVARDYGVRL